MNIREYRIKTKQQLNHKGIQDAARNVDRILMKRLGLSKMELTIGEEKELTNMQKEQLDTDINLLLHHIPVQYIVQEQEFMKLPFYVNEHVLIPQPDTEILVETIVEQYAGKDVTILDLCTGSGAIAISIAHYLPKANIVATDISQDALEVAKRNATTLQVADRIQFYQADIWEGLPAQKWGVIVSNPPYIETAVIPTLALEVQKEPHIALDGGEDGLYFYRNIITKAPQYLQEQGTLYLEIGYNQKEAVEQIAIQTKQYTKIIHRKDLEGNDRVIECRR